MTPGRVWRRSWCGADASSRGVPGQRRRRGPRTRGRAGRLAGRNRPLRRLAGLGELHRPGLLFAGIDLEEAGAVESAGKAIAGTPDGELLVARAHEGGPRPFAAAIIVDR